MWHFHTTVWLQAKRRGVSLLGIVLLVVLVLVVILAVSFWLRRRQFLDNDSVRQRQLSTLARAEEFYFNRWRQYGTLSELVEARLLTEAPRDPVSLQPYQVYFSSLQDEWCAWVELQAKPQTYLIQTESTSRLSTHLPDSIASCKSL